LNISTSKKDYIKNVTTHCELKTQNMFSYVASLTPFSDFNQSPRNVYQCQMAKQTMGIPYHSFPFRRDNKSYKICYAQQPLTRNDNQDILPFNEHMTGIIAIFY
jgi:DNA-directed RNA polymerase I subunit RPA2